MAKNYIQPGEVVTVVSPADTASGDLVVIGDLAGVATHSAKAGENLEIKTKGVYELPKVSAQAWATVGLKIYWDATNKVTTTTATSNTLVGLNLAAAENPSDTGIVRLKG